MTRSLLVRLLFVLINVFTKFFLATPKRLFISVNPPVQSIYEKYPTRGKWGWGRRTRATRSETDVGRTGSARGRQGGGDCGGEVGIRPQGD